MANVQAAACTLQATATIGWKETHLDIQQARGELPQLGGLGLVGLGAPAPQVHLACRRAREGTGGVGWEAGLSRNRTGHELDAAATAPLPLHAPR